MENRLAKLIELVQKLPEACLDETISFVKEKIEDHNEDKPDPPCPHCKSEKVKKFGQKSNHQRYRCNDCGKTYMETTNTVMAYSHCGEAAWKQVIRDTVEGISIVKTAESLMLQEAVVFNMRHKILIALECEEHRNPTILSGVCELDDTYVLESYKGTKLHGDFWRKPRKHGAVAQKRGLSNEYVCISTGVQRDGASYSSSVTRSAPNGDELTKVFDGHIEKSSLIICDGANGYSSLGEKLNCDVADTADNKGFLNINSVNGFHSFIKERYNKYRGVATKYLNRYTNLFSMIFRNDTTQLIDKLYKILFSNDAPRFHTTDDVKTLNLLDV